MSKAELRKNRLKWIEALESGEYKQGKLQLKSSSGTYCCLGVACDISGLGRWSGEWFELRSGKDAAQFPPEEVKNLYKLEGHKEAVLIKMNDNDGKNFQEIANQLREWWGLPSGEESRD